jgi:hypothetical protein
MLTLRRRDGSTEKGLSPVDLRVIARSGELHPLDEIVREWDQQRIAAWRVKGLFPKALCDEMEGVYAKGLDPSAVIGAWESAQGSPARRTDAGAAKVAPPSLPDIGPIELAPQPVSTSTGWFILDDSGGPVGPIETDRLSAMARAGKIKPTTQVARDPKGPWGPAAENPLLMALFDGTVARSGKVSDGNQNVNAGHVALIVLVVIGVAVYNFIIKPAASGSGSPGSSSARALGSQSSVLGHVQFVQDPFFARIGAEKGWTIGSVAIDGDPDSGATLTGVVSVIGHPGNVVTRLAYQIRQGTTVFDSGHARLGTTPVHCNESASFALYLSAEDWRRVSAGELIVTIEH